MALLGWQLLQMILNVIGHLGYEIYPKGFNTHWLFKFKTPSTHHNLHHSKFNGNFSLYFTWWDKWCKTEFKDYHTVYEKVQDRISKKAGALFLICSLSVSLNSDCFQLVITFNTELTINNPIISDSGITIFCLIVKFWNMNRLSLIMVYKLPEIISNK